MRLDVANLDWTQRGDAAAVRATAQGDVAAYVEARTGNNHPIRIRRILRSWRVVQNLASGATAGAACAVRRASPVKIKRASTWRLSRRGFKVQQRDAVTTVLVEKTPAVIYEDHIIVLHNPLKSSGQQDDAVHAARARRVRVTMRQAAVASARRRAGLKPQRKRVVRWAVVGDFNRTPASMSAAIGGHRCYGETPMGIVLGDGWGDVKFSKRRIKGSDHAVLTMQTQEK